MCDMVHPLLTVLFDFMLIGTAITVIATMIAEHVASRQPAVGRPRVARTPVAAGRAPRAVWHNPPAIAARRAANRQPLSHRAA
jgi:hypothetical protein